MIRMKSSRGGVEWLPVVGTAMQCGWGVRASMDSWSGWVAGPRVEWRGCVEPIGTID